MELETRDFFLLLGTLLEERRGALKGARGRITFAVLGGGSWVIDLGSAHRGPVREGLAEDADTIVVASRRGLCSLLEEPSRGAGRPGSLFLWAGDPAPLAALARALGGNSSVFDTRIAAMRGASS